MSTQQGKCKVSECGRNQRSLGSRPGGKVKEYDRDGYMIRNKYQPPHTKYSNYCEFHRYAYNRPT